MIQVLLPLLAPIFGDLIDRVIPDTNAREKTKAEMEAKLLLAVEEAARSQVDINKIEASSSSIFVAGWRPFIGWVCGAALLYQFIVLPIMPILFTLLGKPLAAPLPALDNGLFELVLAMLGLGGLRTWEKFKGVAKK